MFNHPKRPEEGRCFLFVCLVGMRVPFNTGNSLKWVSFFCISLCVCVPVYTSGAVSMKVGLGKSVFVYRQVRIPFNYAFAPSAGTILNHSFPLYGCKCCCT